MLIALNTRIYIQQNQLEFTQKYDYSLSWVLLLDKVIQSVFLSSYYWVSTDQQRKNQSLMNKNTIVIWFPMIHLHSLTLTLLTEYYTFQLNCLSLEIRNTISICNSIFANNTILFTFFKSISYSLTYPFHSFSNCALFLIQFCFKSKNTSFIIAQRDRWLQIAI